MSSRGRPATAVRRVDADAAVATDLGIDRDARGTQRFDVSVHGSHRHLERLGELGGGGAALQLQAQEELDESAGAHVATLVVNPDMVCQGSWLTLRSSTTIRRTNPMTISIVNPAELHDPTLFGYSHSASVAAGSELVFVAGQYASGPNGEVVAGAFADQVGQAFRNVGAALAAHGLEFAQVVQLRSYVVGHDFDKLGAIGQAVFGIWGGLPPTHTVIGVAALATPEIMFEVEAIAVRP